MATLTWSSVSISPTSGTAPLQVAINLDWIGSTAPFKVEVYKQAGVDPNVYNTFVSEQNGLGQRYDSVGTYQLTVKVTGSDGQHIEKTQTITVTGSTPSPSPDPSAQPLVWLDADKFMINEGETVRFIAHAQNYSQPPTFTITYPQGSDTNNAGVFFKEFRTSGVFHVSVKAYNGSIFHASNMTEGGIDITVREPVAPPPPVVAPPAPIDNPPAPTPQPVPQPSPNPGGNPLTTPFDLEKYLKEAIDKIFGPGSAEAASISNKEGAGQLLAALEEAYTKQFLPKIRAVAADYEKALHIDKPIAIADAPAQAGVVSAAGFAAGFAIYLITTLTDLLDPIKGTGIVPAGIDITNALGTDMVSRTIVGAYSKVAVEAPLLKHYNSLARTFRPYGSEADQLLFEGQITKDKWHELYTYAGWPDDLIEAHFQAMFREPSDRMLISMFEDSQVPEDWITSKLLENGYDMSDTTIIRDYAKRKAWEKTRESSKFTIVKRYREGYIDDLEALKELKAARYNQDEILQILQDAYLQRDTERRDDLIAYAKRAFQEDVLSVKEFTDLINRAIVDEEQANYLISTEIYKKNPSTPA